LQEKVPLVFLDLGKIAALVFHVDEESVAVEEKINV